MKNDHTNHLKFVNIETDGVNAEKMLKAFIGLEYFPVIKWLYKIEATPEKIQLTYNINKPSPRAVEEGVQRSLREAGFDQEVATIIKSPGLIHPSAVEELRKIEGILEKDPNDLSWMREKTAEIDYLEQYKFLKINYDSKMLGFEEMYSQGPVLRYARWIGAVVVTRERGEGFLKKWSEET